MRRMAFMFGMTLAVGRIADFIQYCTATGISAWSFAGAAVE